MAFKTLIGMIVVSGVLMSGAQAPAAFDPLGSWRVSTVADDGSPISVDFTITGKPSAYAGEAKTSTGRALPLSDLATTPSGMIALFDLPQGSIVVRISGANGKFTGSWGQMNASFPIKAERAGK